MSPRALLLLAASAALAGAARADMTVTGRFLYVDRAFGFDGWTGAEPELPVRRARVRVLDAATGTVLASGETDETGGFALPVTGSGTADLLVRCFTSTSAFGAPVRVVDPGDVLYSVSSPIVAGWSLGADLDVGEVVAQKTLVGSDQGSPFDVFDMLVLAMEYVTDQGAPAPPQPVVASWPQGSISFASGNTAFIAADDGYDGIVVLHEVGHVLHNLYSDSDSPGGSHGFTQSDQDPALSFSEGWASFFAGAVRRHAGLADPGFYLDAFADGTTGPASVQLRMRFEDGEPWGPFTGGEADEGAVFCALWNLVDDVATPDGFPGDDDPVDGSFLFPGGRTADEVLWEAFVGPTVVGAFALNVTDLWDGTFVDAGADHYDELAAAMAEWKIRYVPDAFEPDDDAAAAAAVALGDWGPIRTLYRLADPAVPGDGDEDHLVFAMPAGRVFEVETRYPDAAEDAETYCDPRLELYGPSGELLDTAEFGGVGRNAKITWGAAVAGTYRAVVSTSNLVRRTGSYQVRVLDVGPVVPPAISGLSVTSTTTVTDGFPLDPTVFGSGFLGTTGVTVGGVPAEFDLLSDGIVRFELPVVSALGELDVVVTNVAGAAVATLEVLPPPAPTINAAEGFSFWSDDVLPVRVGSDPFDLVLLAFSLSDEPTSLPGLVELGIGAGGTDLHLVWSETLPASGVVEPEFPLPEPITGVPVWLQGAALPSAAPVLPLVPTNVEPGTIL